MLDVKKIIHNKHKDPNKTKGQYPLKGIVLLFYLNYRLL